MIPVPIAIGIFHGIAFCKFILSKAKDSVYLSGILLEINRFSTNTNSIIGEVDLSVRKL